MLQLDGTNSSVTLTALSFRLDSFPARSTTYYEYRRCVSALATSAFSLAKDLDNFLAWSQAASSFVDHYLRLAAICGGWVLEDEISVEGTLRRVNQVQDQLQAKLLGQITKSTFLKAYACHHPSSPSPTIIPNPSTSSSSLSSSQRAPHTTPQLASSLPAHHPQLTQAATSTPN